MDVIVHLAEFCVADILEIKIWTLNSNKDVSCLYTKNLKNAKLKFKPPRMSAVLVMKF